MASLEIITYPNVILRKKSAPIKEINTSVQTLIDEMIATMHAASGIGLAAPQVGVSARIMVVDPSVGEDPEAIITLINPEILSCEGEDIREEGCLSVPGFYEELARYNKVAIKGIDRTGKEVMLEGEGLLARAFQHEVDHLNGILFFDHLSKVRKELLKLKLKKALKNKA
jgi:peptide deformylase